MRAKNRELHEAADMENRVAYGTAQYEAQRMAHKTEDSDQEGGDADGDDDMQTHFDDGDDWAYDTDFSDPAVVKKLFPPPAPDEHVAPKDEQAVALRIRGRCALSLKACARFASAS